MTDTNHFIQRNHPYLNKALTACAGASVLIILVLLEQGVFSSNDTSEPFASKPTTLSIKPVESFFSKRRETDPTYPLPSFIAEQMPGGSYRQVREELIKQSTDAIQTENRQQLGSSLALLGAAALNENDLDSARIYLDEALDVYEEQADAMGIGSVELLRSRVETVARENARDASSAYEVMQIAAWMVVKDRFYESEYPVQTAIDENLRLKRFASAAAGYEMLERGYRSAGDTLAANDAAIEALKLHAASGRIQVANNALDRLALQALPYEDTERLKKDIRQLEHTYHRSLRAVGRARDYEQLYRHLVAAGDPVQAWTFREKANQSLSQTSKRAMHRRQTGIVALLYNSNKNIEAATRSLERAKTLFSQESRPDLIEYIESAEKLVW